MLCSRAGLSLQAQHSPLYPLLSLPFRIFVQSIYHKVVYHLISSAANFLPFTIPPRASFNSQLLLSQFLFLFFISSSIILPLPTLSSTTAFFILSVHLTRSILLALAQMVACLPLVQRVRGSIPGEVVNFLLKIFNFGARRGGDVHFLITRLCITGLD